MKLIAPAGVTSTTHDGIEIHVNDDGTVDVPEHVARVLYSHGFHPPKGASQLPGKDAPRDVLIDHARGEIMAQMEGMSTEDLRRAVGSMAANGDRSKAELIDDDDEADTPPLADPNATEADVEKMSRKGLFAYLKVKGVSVSLPITNDVLRGIALKTAQG
jgi:hypothetical protein